MKKDLYEKAREKIIPIDLLELHQSELKTLLDLQQTMYDREINPVIIQEIEKMIFEKEKLIKQAKDPEKIIPQDQIRFRLLVQDGVQVLLQKEWSEEDEKPTLEVIFYVGVLKGTYRLYFENEDLRDNAFNEYTGEDAQPLITRFKELAKEAE